MPDRPDNPTATRMPQGMFSHFGTLADRLHRPLDVAYDYYNNATNPGLTLGLWDIDGYTGGIDSLYDLSSNRSPIFVNDLHRVPDGANLAVVQSQNTVIRIRDLNDAYNGGEPNLTLYGQLIMGQTADVSDERYAAWPEIFLVAQLVVNGTELTSRLLVGQRPVPENPIPLESSEVDCTLAGMTAVFPVIPRTWVNVGVRVRGISSAPPFSTDVYMYMHILGFKSKITFLGMPHQILSI